jgi:hypothetical protein
MRGSSFCRSSTTAVTIVIYVCQKTERCRCSSSFRASYHSAAMSEVSGIRAPAAALRHGRSKTPSGILIEIVLPTGCRSLTQQHKTARQTDCSFAGAERGRNGPEAQRFASTDLSPAQQPLLPAGQREKRWRGDVRCHDVAVRFSAHIFEIWLAAEEASLPHCGSTLFPTRAGWNNVTFSTPQITCSS